MTYPATQMALDDLVSAAMINRWPVAVDEIPGAAASYTFTSIPQWATHLMIVAQLSETSAGLATLAVTFNGDAGNVYSWTYLRGNNRAASSAGAAADGTRRIGLISGTAPKESANIIFVPDYSSAVNHSAVGLAFAATGVSGSNDLFRAGERARLPSDDPGRDHLDQPRPGASTRRLSRPSICSGWSEMAELQAGVERGGVDREAPLGGSRRDDRISGRLRSCVDQAREIVRKSKTIPDGTNPADLEPKTRVALTKDEIVDRDRLAEQVGWEELRRRRDQLLVDSDWRVQPDAPGDRGAWVAYRQQLRDLPARDEGSREGGMAEGADMSAVTSPFVRPLHPGDRGPDVVAVKRAMARIGRLPWVKFDSVYNKKLQAAMAGFQRDVGIKPATGFMGRQTFNVLVAHKPTKAHPGEKAFDEYANELLWAAYDKLHEDPALKKAQRAARRLPEVHRPVRVRGRPRRPVEQDQLQPRAGLLELHLQSRSSTSTCTPTRTRRTRPGWNATATRAAAST